MYVQKQLDRVRQAKQMLLTIQADGDATALKDLDKTHTLPDKSFQVFLNVRKV